MNNLESKDVAKIEITEQMFHNMMLKENEIRGVISKTLQYHASTHKKEDHKLPKIKSIDQILQQQEKPQSPMTLKALDFFDKLD